eukprot:scaffold36277_cov117-Isochrysis_galbana.AAC.1
MSSGSALNMEPLSHASRRRSCLAGGQPALWRASAPGATGGWIEQPAACLGCAHSGHGPCAALQSGTAGAVRGTLRARATPRDEA